MERSRAATFSGYPHPSYMAVPMPPSPPPTMGSPAGSLVGSPPPPHSGCVSPVRSNSTGGSANTFLQPQAFPKKLFQLLQNEDQTLISWRPHGLAFIVNDEDRFVAETLPRYFKQTKIASFQRQLNLYGFHRLTKGVDKGAFVHPNFQRGRPELLAGIKRIAKKKAYLEEQKKKAAALAAQNQAAGGADSGAANGAGAASEFSSAAQQQQYQQQYNSVYWYHYQQYQQNPELHQQQWQQWQQQYQMQMQYQQQMAQQMQQAQRARAAAASASATSAANENKDGDAAAAPPVTFTFSGQAQRTQRQPQPHAQPGLTVYQQPLAGSQDEDEQEDSSKATTATSRARANTRAKLSRRRSSTDPVALSHALKMQRRRSLTVSSTGSSDATTTAAANASSTPTTGSAPSTPTRDQCLSLDFSSVFDEPDVAAAIEEAAEVSTPRADDDCDVAELTRRSSTLSLGAIDWDDVLNSMSTPTAGLRKSVSG